jgi:hypothetical protein
MPEKKKKETKQAEPVVAEEVAATEETANVPATTAVEVIERRAGENIEPYRVTTALMKAKWGNVASLPVDEAVVVARTIHESFPMFGPWQIINNFDVLAGKTLYLNANGYIDIAMSHPMTESPPLLRQIEHGSEDWATYLGDIQPNKIAAAYVCEFKRKDRAIPFVEANYCPMDDDLLYRGKRDNPNRKLKDDWRPLAMKIARTRAIRRCLRFAFSPTEAAAIYAEKQVEAILQKAERRELPKPVVAPEDPYGDPDPDGEREKTREWLADEPEDFDPNKVAISEGERRKTVADLLTERTGQLVEIKDVSTKKITYGIYADLIARLYERFPFKDREVIEVEAIVEGEEGQEELPL